MPFIDKTDVSSQFAFPQKHDIIICGEQLHVKEIHKTKGVSYGKLFKIKLSGTA